MDSPTHASARALEVLNRTFGYPAFRGHQSAIIAHIETGNDALVLMPTGGGKSLCYQIPALVRNGVGIVVSPLIALMQDQVDALLELGIAAAFLNSSQSLDEANATERRVREGEIKLLDVAPERVLTERFLSLLESLDARDQLALFAIDEAHCVSQWGHDFRADYLQLAVLAERFPSVPRVALTATADALTRAEMRERLRLTEAREFCASFDRPNIHYTIAERTDDKKQLKKFLQNHQDESGIVYCLSRKKVDATAEWLCEAGFPALAYHAGMSAEARRDNQSRFLREDGIIMVATIAFGMGIDKPDVRFVAHLDLPKSVESYYQETGRAGRDGDAAQAWMLYGLSDVVQQARFIDGSEANEEFKRAARIKLDSLLGLCETTACRRGRLLSYFGETVSSGACGNCDNCESPPEQWDATEACRMALSAIYRTGQRYGSAYIIDVIRGATNENVRNRGHASLPVFGIGKATPERTWRNVLRQLITHGWVQVDVEAFGALRLTDAARPVLRGETPVMLRVEQVEDTSARTSKFAKTSGGRRGQAGAAPAHDLPPDQQRVFDALKAWRLDAARANRLPAYVILHDRVLVEIAETQPQSLTALHGISGIGQAKIDRYGSAIVACVRAMAG